MRLQRLLASDFVSSFRDGGPGVPFGVCVFEAVGVLPKRLWL